MADADLILHVVDASDASHPHQLATTSALLDELHLAHVPQLLVYNKCDRLAAGAVRRLSLGRSDVITISALDKGTLKPLMGVVSNRLQDRWLRPDELLGERPELA